MSQNEIIARRLSELRKEKGVKQDEIAEILNVKRATVANYEAGKRAPDYETIIKLADYYGVSCDYILRGIECEFAEIGGTTGLMQEAIEELKTEKLIAENNTKEYSNYFKITNSFIQSGIFLDITLCVTKLENSLKEKNILLNMQKKTFTETNIDCEIFDDKGFENRLEEVEDKIGFCFYRIQNLIAEFARDYCSKFIDEITINKNELVQIIRESIIEAARNNNSVPRSDTVEGILKDGESNGNNS